MFYIIKDLEWFEQTPYCFVTKEDSLFGYFRISKVDEHYYLDYISDGYACDGEEFESLEEAKLAASDNWKEKLETVLIAA